MKASIRKLGRKRLTELWLGAGVPSLHPVEVGRLLDLERPPRRRVVQPIHLRHVTPAREGRDSDLEPFRGRQALVQARVRGTSAGAQTA